MNKKPVVDPALQELINAFENGLIEPIKQLIREYRVYYDEDGSIIQISDSNWNHPESGNYLVVDEYIHKNWMMYRVKKGQLELKPSDPTSELQLKKSNTGYCVVKNNPALLLEENEHVEITEYYDYKNR